MEWKNPMTKAKVIMLKHELIVSLPCIKSVNGFPPPIVRIVKLLALICHFHLGSILLLLEVFGNE